MDVVKVKVATGRTSGSGPARRLRADGKIPGVVYGLGQDPTSVSVDYGDLRRALTGDAGLNAVLNLDVDGTTELSVVKDLQRDPLKQTVIHVDFLRVDPEAEIEVDVPVSLTGEAVELGRENGIVQQVMFSLVVAAKPGAAPDLIEIDISDMMIGDTITVADVPLPDGASHVDDLEASVATGQMTRAALVDEEEAEVELDEDGNPIEPVEGEDAEGEGGDSDSDDDSSED